MIDEFPGEIKACYIGYSDISLDDKITNVLKYASGNDWLIIKSKSYIYDHVRNMIKLSDRIKKEALSNQIQYFDTSTDFQNSIEKVIKYFD